MTDIHNVPEQNKSDEKSALDQKKTNISVDRKRSKVNATHLPGRTFLVKRRYYPDIAALTPLTPLTYKQNAVNAFIPTKKRR